MKYLTGLVAVFSDHDAVELMLPIASGSQLIGGCSSGIPHDATLEIWFVNISQLLVT